MVRDLDIHVSPAKAADPDQLKSTVARKLDVAIGEISGIQIIRKSIDARRRPVLYNIKLRVFIGEKMIHENPVEIFYPDV